jgi:hypothetical protein
MIESFVDLTYRGLSLGRRLKLADVRPTTGFVEAPAPMPVGTQIAIITDDTVALDAVVVAVREQVAGSEKVPGMVLKPRLDGDAAKSWWQQRVSLPETDQPAAPPPKAVPPPIPVTVVSRRMTNPGIGVPDLVDDGQDTGVMDAVDPSAVVEVVAIPEPTPPPIVDDGKQTVAMDAVDLAALGLTSPSGQIPAQSPPEEDDNGDKPSDSRPGGRRKRKKR